MAIGRPGRAFACEFKAKGAIFLRSSKMLDSIDRQILQALVANARISLKALSSQVKLSSPSVSERLRRLEERGVIRAFTVEVDPRALGYELQAVVRIRAHPGKLHLARRQLEQIPEIVECDSITGEDCFVATLFVRSIQQLDRILDRIKDTAETNTSVIKSHVVPRRLPPLAIADELATDTRMDKNVRRARRPVVKSTVTSR
jgi:Lrp/AsnC family transcriptional regulator, leucine-responsive regulatory protein